jgi:hypothetical protein
MQERLPSRERRFLSLEAPEDRVVPSANAVLEWNAIALQIQVLDNALGGPCPASRGVLRTLTSEPNPSRIK